MRLSALATAFLIRIASKNGQAIASIITMQYKDVLVYKYGCSDSRFNNLGGNSLLFWRAIQDAKKSGLLKFDLGRSEADNRGLITFKENWGAVTGLWTIIGFLSSTLSFAFGWRSRVAKGVFSVMPDTLFARYRKASLPSHRLIATPT